jgi:hypothetical protein
MSFFKGVQEAGLTSEMGYGGETYWFYVAYGAYDKAVDLVKSIFPSEYVE